MNAVPDFHVGKLDQNDKSIILAMQAADIRKDNGKIVGACVYNGDFRIYVRLPVMESITSVDDARQWLSENEIIVCAPMATPYAIQLAPQQIAALTGINTLYTDSGDTAVSGRADPVWLTQSLMERIAALESAATNI